MAIAARGGYNAWVRMFRRALPVIALVILAAACSGSTARSDAELADAPVPTATSVAPDSSDDPEPSASEPNDTAQAVRLAILEDLIAEYPGVRASLAGDVAVLIGVVETFDDKVRIDEVVRAAGFAISNEVNVVGDEPIAPDTDAAYSLLDLVLAQPELSYFAHLVDASGLADSIDDPSSTVTVLAPTNDAFAAWLGRTELDQASFEAWLNDAPIDADSLAANHLIDGVASIEEIETSETISIGGAPITDDVELLVGDVEASNGALHISMTVVQPSSAWADVPDELGSALALDPITFAAGGATLTDDGRAQLDAVADYLRERPGLVIEIGGHTDSDGADETNFALSLARAEAVTDYLVGAGIDDDTLVAVGYGEGSPIAPNDTDENKALNRRIEFRPS